jgi:hypothetical protein
VSENTPDRPGRREPAWPAVPPQLAFDKAAPKILRNNDQLPVQAQEAMRQIWDGIVVETSRHFSQYGYREARKPKNLKALLRRLERLLNDAQELMIVCGTYWPMPGSATRLATIATGGSAGVTGVEQAITYGSAGVAATSVVTSSLIIELFETYMAASARTQQYRAAQRDPDHYRIAVDLADAWAGRRREQIFTRQFVDIALERLEVRLMARAWTRLMEAISAVVGIVWAGGSTVRAMSRVLRLPMRPADEEELARMAARIKPDGTPEYDAQVQRLGELLAGQDE